MSLNFDKFLEKAREPMTEQQLIEYKIGSIDRSISRLKNQKFESEPGVYGTASAYYSEARYQISCLEGEREKLVNRLEILKNQLPNT